MSSMSTRVALALALLVGGAGRCSAQADQKPKQFVIQEVVNEETPILVRVEAFHPEPDRPVDRVFREGEEMVVKVIPEKDCYIHVIDLDPQGNATCLFPNKFQRDNLARGGAELQIPSDSDRRRFKIVTGPPFGEEVICVIATARPLELFQGQDLRSQQVTPLPSKAIRDLSLRFYQVEDRRSKEVTPLPMQDVRQARRDRAFRVEARSQWGEHKVVVRTLPAGSPSQVDPKPPVNPARPRRLAVCIGICDYKDETIPDLTLSEQDAREMEKVLREQCGFDEVTLLLGQQATREAIRRAIFEGLRDKSRPGDTVVIFFSGHGGHCADVDNDEKDGDKEDEYLVPYDGIFADAANTMILDDAFGRWVNELQGRRTLVILDNCYSGGSAKGVRDGARPAAPAARRPGVVLRVGPQPSEDAGHRGKGKGLGAPVEANRLGARSYHTLSKGILRVDRLRFSKDIEGAGTVLLAASQANQLAFEMRGGEGSVLTYYLVKALREGSGPLLVKDVFDAIKPEVEDYVRKTFLTDQNPVLTGDVAGLRIRP